MKIVLIKPSLPDEVLYGKLKDVGNFQQPLGLGYLASYLRKNGYLDVKIIDGSVETLTEDQILSRIDADVAGITATTLEISSAISLAKRIKETRKIPVVLGGAHVTAIPADAMLNRCFDVGVIGEGEITFLELVKCFESCSEFKKVNGIAYLEGEKVALTEGREPISDLDSLPFPSRDLMPPLERYRATPASYKRSPVGSIITSRGCPYQCTYCDKAIFGQKFRARPPKNIVDEIEELVNKYKAREIRFWDDVINLNNERIIEICKEMINRGIRVDWTCVGRVNNVTQEQLYWMKKAGCWQVSYGIESGNDEILKRIRKGVTTNLLRKAITLTSKSGIKVRGFFMIGLPGETEKTMQDTIDFAKSLPLDTASFYITTPYPNTEIWKEFGITDTDWSKFRQNDPENIVFVPNGLTKEIIRKYYKKAYKEFYLRPTSIIKRVLAVRSFEEVVSGFKGIIGIGGM